MLVQNASRDNKAQIINYFLTNEPCNRRRNTTRHLNISLLTITHDNNSTKKKTLPKIILPCLQTCKKIQTISTNFGKK
jgi:hypothetical protein